MAFSNTFDTATPQGTDAPSTLDNKHRETKSAIQERANVEHYWPLTGTQVSNSHVGEHRKITFHEPIAKPPSSAGHMHIYGKEVDSVIELHVLDESGNEIQITDKGKILFASLGNIANNTALSAVDFAGTGTVDLIKADVNDVAVLVDGTQLDTDAAPTADKGLANKKYVDDQVAPLVLAPVTYAGGESVTFGNGLIMKFGNQAFDGTTAIVSFDSDFDNAIISVSSSALDAGPIDYVISAKSVSGVTFKAGGHHGTPDSVDWIALGY